MTAPYDQSVRSEWVVDLATGRIHRWVPRPCAGANGSETLIRGRAEGEGTAMTDDKEREQARKDLNPIEDIKGAIRYIKEFDPVEKVEEFMETAVKILEPSESDLRVVEPEEDTVSETEEPGGAGKPLRPADADAQPDAKALNKEHRGY